MVLSGVAIAIFSYNGYGAAVNFSEEIAGHKSGIAKAILWSLLITVVAELVPIIATLPARRPGTHRRTRPRR